MNADVLLAHYERIAKAPDAIERLRRFVLDLAVRGKLVPQDAQDEPASQLLKRIDRARSQLVKAGEIRKPKPLPAVYEAPFDLPHPWQWTRIREVTSDRGQAVPEGEFTYIDVTAIDKERGVVANPKILSVSEAPSRARKITRKNDVIYSCVRPYLLNVAIVEDDFDPPSIASTAFAVLNGYGLVLPMYIWITLRSSFMVECVEATQRGQAYPAINDADFALLPFPLPPLAEQHRIVAKVDELMVLCDQLEAARTAREAMRDRLAAASLARLNTPDPETFPGDTRFALDALPALTARPDQIKHLRQTILNLAIRGKLVPQCSSLQESREFLAKVAAAKAQLKRDSDDGRIKRSPDPQASALPIDLPSGWAVQSFENLFLFIDYRGNTPQKTEAGIPLITAKNVRMRRLSREPREFISSSTYKTWMTRGFPKPGDLFFTTEAPLANVCMNELTEPFALAQRVICLQPYLSFDTTFIMLALTSSVMQALIDQHATGMTARGIKAAKLKPLPIPIPSPSEQHRIVARVGELMTLCDKLEASLTAAVTARTRLLEATLREAFEPAEVPILEAAE